MASKLTPIRILHVVHAMNRGGVETTLMNIFRNIDRNKVIFDFLVSTREKAHYDDEIISLGGNIFNVTPRKESFMRNKGDLSSFFKKHKYNIIHQHVSSLSYIEPLKKAMYSNVPIRIVHSRNTKQGGSKIHKYIHYWNRFFIRKYATDYFACSDLAAKWLFGSTQYNKGNYTIINNGIDTNKFIYNEQIRKQVRDELGINGDTFVVGHVGRFHNQKNHSFLIKVFKELLKKRSNSVLLLIGEGSLREDIENQINQIGLTNNVILTGVRKDIPELLQCMDIFIMPSFYEGLPGTIIEAQGAGLPCLISDTITKQVKITNLVNFESLEKDEFEWSERAFEIVATEVRRNTQSEIVEAGFDMKIISKQLEDFYLNRFYEIQNK